MGLFRVRGRFGEVRGTGTIAPDGRVSGSLTLIAASLDTGNQRRDDRFWNRARDMEVPETLAYKLRLFAARGRVALYDDEAFQASNWTSVLLGHGLIPRDYDPLVDLLEPVIGSTSRRVRFTKPRPIPSTLCTWRMFMARWRSTARTVHLRASSTGVRFRRWWTETTASL